MAFPWAQWETPDSEVQQVAEKFVFANCAISRRSGYDDAVPGIGKLELAWVRGNRLCWKSLLQI